MAKNKSPALYVRGFSVGAHLGAGSNQAASERVVDAGFDEKSIAIHALIQDLSFAMNFRKQLSVRWRQKDVAQRAPHPNRAGEHAFQRFEAAVRDRRDEDR